MSADFKNCLNFVKIIAGLPGIHCSYSRQRIYNARPSLCIITVVTRFNVFTCPCQQVNHGSLSTTNAYSVRQWLIHAIASPYCQHSADRKQSFDKCLRRRSRNQILSNQSQNWVNVWLPFTASFTWMSRSTMRMMRYVLFHRVVVRQQDFSSFLFQFAHCNTGLLHLSSNMSNFDQQAVIVSVRSLDH